MRRSLAALCATAALASAVIAPAQAITDGEPDGSAHRNVAPLVFYSEDGGEYARFRCSGALVTPTVVLTAAHCTDGTKGKTIVTFASEPTVPLPRAADDPGTGVSATGYTVAPKSYYSGTAKTHPQYSDFTDLENWNDVGVITLDRAVRGVTAATIAPLDHLDAYAEPLLSKTIFTLVGYGTEVRKPESGPQKPTPFGTPLIRRNTTSNGQKMTDQIVQMNGNPANVIAGGGTCFGDSGGPSFLDGYLTTVTSYGYTDNCRYIGGYQRVDIPAVQDWLVSVGALPVRRTLTAASR